MKKTSKNSMELKKTTQRTYRDDLTFYSWKQGSIPDAFIEKVADDLQEWAITNDEALKLTQFFVERGIDDSDFYRWMEKNTKLQRAHKMALMAIGNRREIGAMKRKYDGSTSTFTMSLYDKGWKQVTEWKAGLNKTNDESKSGPQFIVIEKMPESNLVPRQEKTDESGDTNTSK